MLIFGGTNDSWAGVEVGAFKYDKIVREDITSSTVEICRHYGIPFIELQDVSKQNGHPDIAGMKAIASQVLAALQP